MEHNNQVIHTYQPLQFNNANGSVYPETRVSKGVRSTCAHPRFAVPPGDRPAHPAGEPSGHLLRCNCCLALG